MKGQLADVVVGQHIESDCQSDPAKERRKVYTNRCSKKGCKRKELVPIKCEKCRLNYCLKHRHEQDHSCQGFQGTGRVVSSAGAAALFRAMIGKYETLGTRLSLFTSENHSFQPLQDSILKELSCNKKQKNKQLSCTGVQILRITHSWTRHWAAHLTFREITEPAGITPVMRLGVLT